jgi:hypothetical protein
MGRLLLASGPSAGDRERQCAVARKARIIDGKFTAVQQAVGISPKNKAAAAYLRGFVEEAKSFGWVISGHSSASV